MNPIRCLIADVTHCMLGDIVKRVVEEEESIELVGNTSNLSNISRIIESQSIELLIVVVNDKMLQQLHNVMSDELSGIMVIGLMEDGRRAVVYLDDIGVDDIIKMTVNYARR